jgi:hypothetical protein
MNETALTSAASPAPSGFDQPLDAFIRPQAPADKYFMPDPLMGSLLSRALLLSTQPFVVSDA